MADKYYVHDKTDNRGDHEVHKEGCSKMPDAKDRTYLGSFNNCQDAVDAAKKLYTQVDGCFWCSRACHKH